MAGDGGGDSFDPERWGLGGSPAPAPAPGKPTRRPPPRRFLKGPVPMDWLGLAMRLRGKALAVGVLLWHLGGMAGSRTVRFCLARASASGIPASTARRAVNDLAAHGLVSVVRRPGQGLDVTILDCPEV